jgi:hypothetical protein
MDTDWLLFARGFVFGMLVVVVLIKLAEKP